MFKLKLNFIGIKKPISKFPFTFSQQIKQIKNPISISPLFSHSFTTNSSPEQTPQQISSQPPPKSPLNFPFTKKHKKQFLSSQQVIETFQKIRHDIHNAPFIKEWKNIRDEMERKKYNFRRIQIIALLILLGIFVVFYDLITSWASTRASVLITTNSLDDEEFKERMVKIIESLSHSLIHSPSLQSELFDTCEKKIVKLLSPPNNNNNNNKNHFNNQLINEEGEEKKNDEISSNFQKMIVDLLCKELQSEKIQNNSVEFTNEIANELMTSPNYEDIREDIYSLLVELIYQLSIDESIHNQLSDLTASQISSLYTYLLSFIKRPSSPSLPSIHSNENNK